MKIQIGNRIAFSKKPEGFGVIGVVEEITTDEVMVLLYKKKGTSEIQYQNKPINVIWFSKSEENKYGINLWDTTQSYSIEGILVATWVKH